jgi:integration host factor subunit beta
MTRAELIDRLFERMQDKQLPMTATDVDASVRDILDMMVESLARGRRAEFRGFGSFNVTERKERAARNPRTGEAVLVPAKRVAHFKAGRELRNLTAASKG